MIVRILLSLAVVMSILYFPWWMTLILCVILLIRYPAYELIAYGLFADALYAPPSGIQYLFTFTFFLLLCVSFVIKSKIIFYHRT